MPAPTVLVVDPDPDSLHIYGALLEHRGLRVLRAQAAREGFRLACEAGPDLIVLELHLEEIEGVSLRERLKLEPRTSGVPVVALSTLTVPLGDPARTGCDAFLPKPCAPSRLYDEISKLIEPPVPLPG